MENFIFCTVLTKAYDFLLHYFFIGKLEAHSLGKPSLWLMIKKVSDNNFPKLHFDLVTELMLLRVLPRDLF